MSGLQKTWLALIQAGNKYLTLMGVLCETVAVPHFLCISSGLDSLA